MKELPPKEVYERFVESIASEGLDPAYYAEWRAAYHSLQPSFSYEPKLLLALLELLKETYKDYVEACKQLSRPAIVSFDDYCLIMFSGVLLGRQTKERGL